MRYFHHLGSVLRRKLFQRSSPLIREESASTVIKNQVEFLPLYIRCFNAQGLVNKFLRLHDFLSSVHVDIVSISETWLDSSVKDSEFVPK